jgi:hypothetical protein
VPIFNGDARLKRPLINRFFIDEVTMPRFERGERVETSNGSDHPLFFVTRQPLSVRLSLQASACAFMRPSSRGFSTTITLLIRIGDFRTIFA